MRVMASLIMCARNRFIQKRLIGTHCLDWGYTPLNTYLLGSYLLLGQLLEPMVAASKMA